MDDCDVFHHENFQSETNHKEMVESQNQPLLMGNCTMAEKNKGLQDVYLFVCS